ncbi:hypothetical protein OHB24_22980 [Kribbella sp. NBC_00482]|uniref:solute carrier family 23 protein n=1 Tax=Kribbella sp. NBC_00482 TaxID=2975968 RepID=UPI002E1963E5
MTSSTPATARPEDERLPFAQLLVYGTQHILTMYGGLIAPPLIVGTAAGLSAPDIGLLVTAGIFVSGLATLLQSLGFGNPSVFAAAPDERGTPLSGTSES